jgi:GntR family transcriptional regulator, transcriptional repressor for pyruvate dehydrogenase complex
MDATVTSVTEAVPGARRTVTQRAIEQIKQMLAAGELRPGQRLPTERDLAAQLGLSRSSMREAIRALTVLGVLQARHGSGIYVTELGAGDLLETFGLMAEVVRGERLLELLQVRRLLEPTATAMAAARITDQELAEVERHLLAMEATDDPDELLTADMAFHRSVVAAAGNPTLAAIVEGLSSRTFRARLGRGRQEPGVFAQVRRDHARIHRALAARDPEAARAAASVHILEVEDWLRAHLSDWA